MRSAAIDTYVLKVVRTLAGMLMGLLIGLALTLALVTGRARFQQQYLESASELVGPMGAPMPVAVVAGGALGWTGSHALAALAAGSTAGGAAGAIVGWGIGSMVSDEDADQWAGGVLGTGLGAVAGALGLVLPILARRRRAAAAALVVGSVLLACSDDPPEPPAIAPAPPATAEAVEAVVILAGDPGEARYHRYPVLPAMAAEVESWAAHMRRDSSLVVVMLGDILYPVGMRPPQSPEFADDSARVADQIAVIRGDAARRYGARMYFLAGNHDWGLKTDREGTQRLLNLGNFLGRMRIGGAAVDLVPEAGTGTPYVVDVGGIRLVLLDTAWWIFDAEPARKQDVVNDMAAILASAGDRPVVIAAHHPLVSGGPHGVFRPVWENLGIRYLLSRSGTILQDIESGPYRDFRYSLEKMFSRGARPLLFAGGHDHSLQVIQHEDTAAPYFSVVSGSVSKVSGAGWVAGTLFRRAAPGYMQLVLRRSGAVDLFVTAAPERYLACPDLDPADEELHRCMQEGIAAFRTVFSMRLKDADR